MLLSIKTKLKLNKSEKTLMAKHAGIARFTYNWGLGMWKTLYTDGYKPNHRQLRTFFNNEVKPVLPWINEKGICQKITQYAFDHLGDAYKRFWKKESEYPSFKKKGRHDSFTIDASGKAIRVGGTSIKLPTIGWVSTYEGLPHTTTKKFTISRTADSWYISFSYEIETIPPTKTFERVGVDLGIKTLATLSTGVVYSNAKHYKTHLAKLKRLSKAYARKEKGSNRQLKAKIKLARHHAKISNIRSDNLHKITTDLCKNHAKNNYRRFKYQRNVS